MRLKLYFSKQHTEWISVIVLGHMLYSKYTVCVYFNAIIYDLQATYGISRPNSITVYITTSVIDYIVRLLYKEFSCLL